MEWDGKLAGLETSIECRKDLVSEEMCRLVEAFENANAAMVMFGLALMAAEGLNAEC